jgi:transposase-like protein
MTRRKKPTINPARRAAAIADLLAGEQPAVVAERYGINPVTVRSWAQRYASGRASVPQPVATPVQPAVERQKVAIGETILALLEAKLNASRALAEAVRDPAWLKKQSAADLAALGAYLDTTAFAIGDRLAAPPPEPPPPSLPSRRYRRR